jgi:hypothetical protein
VQEPQALGDRCPHRRPGVLVGASELLQFGGPAVRRHTGRLGLPQEPWLTPAVAAVFVDPLVALGAAEVASPHPAPPGRCLLAPSARTIIGSALIAAGEDIPREGAPMN